MPDAKNTLAKINYWNDWAKLSFFMLCVVIAGVVAISQSSTPVTGEAAIGTILGTTVIVGWLMWSLVMRQFWHIRSEASPVRVRSNGQ
ncbi:MULTISPECIES: hypothetical protein [Ectopseudomonas]|jgi:protein-S-isoprenylcysteine O-methyltransferase Ste14|uniref:Uncharacterized protein n=2 Tax=Ectopseudomonas TaxID=3236654 RepID=A0A1G6Q479_9GAMM|nr:MULTISPECIES: hypothetical protein [Pseudomonas]ALN21769.1 hypothetical protein DW68_024130 [Pseudomonas mendocina S5.2]KER98172.1 hypothetical protein HN51_25595 [Pseudomonas mendocina]MBP3062057.1 hypothetical protein [Pseudomonas chengduensis]NNB75349.1 hypothetical protein [Pseudomonas chengduensis]OEO24403.1 hypothetical protein AX279_17190 [Pseudomonas sp. J237]